LVPRRGEAASEARSKPEGQVVFVAVSLGQGRRADLAKARRLPEGPLLGNAAEAERIIGSFFCGTRASEVNVWNCLLAPQTRPSASGRTTDAQHASVAMFKVT
jgi:hypothetical protein